ncbi:related to dihydrofolate reductase [Claviceps purpurea 20.1]|uniref:Related to dihydrofolate reductase n=1 Tax=Claviceps purpurea (strain 20.1) TaxID=1111077 RepID=M1WFA8_CLAP2|nr:related to dihydrofolate reductase [Claviceps purpurea 20.1]
MAATTPASQSKNAKQNVKILMLHGYTQSGPLFRAKTRALEKVLSKVLSPLSLTPQLIYPTAPNRLLPQDIPGFVPSSDIAPSSSEEDYQPDTWAWWRRDDASGNYLLLEEGMATIADAIREVDGIDGICGFSQGAAAASLVAAALEPNRVLPEGDTAARWVHGLREANGGKAVRFAVSYSGFWPPVESLQFLYEPKIETPMMHYLGSLDTVVEEGTSQALVERCADGVTVVHPGGHYVPVSKEWVMPLAGFIKQHAQGLLVTRSQD